MVSYIVLGLRVGPGNREALLEEGIKIRSRYLLSVAL